MKHIMSHRISGALLSLALLLVPVMVAAQSSQTPPPILKKSEPPPKPDRPGGTRKPQVDMPSTNGSSRHSDASTIKKDSRQERTETANQAPTSAGERHRIEIHQPVALPPAPLKPVTPPAISPSRERDAHPESQTDQGRGRTLAPSSSNPQPLGLKPATGSDTKPIVVTDGLQREPAKKEQEPKAKNTDGPTDRRKP